MSCLCAVRGAHVSVSPVLTRCANAVRPGACCALCLEQNNHRRAGHEAEIPNLDRYVQGKDVPWPAESCCAWWWDNPRIATLHRPLSSAILALCSKVII